MNQWLQLWGLFRRETARIFKAPLQTIGASIVHSTLYLLIFGVSLGQSIQLQDDFPYLAFLIPGLIAMSLIKNAFDNASASIVGQKYANEIQDLRTTPLALHQICLAKAASSLVRGFLIGTITYAVGQIFYLIWQYQYLSLVNPLPFVFFLTVGGFAFGSLGIAVGMWSKSFEHIGAASMMILLPLIYLGGVFFSLENAHLIWQTLSHFNPLFYLINGIRYGMLGKADVHLGLASFVSVLFAIVCYTLAYLSLRKSSRYKWG